LQARKKSVFGGYHGNPQRTRAPCTTGVIAVSPVDDEPRVAIDASAAWRTRRLRGAGAGRNHTAPEALMVCGDFEALRDANLDGKHRRCLVARKIPFAGAPRSPVHRQAVDQPPLRRC
jgi:hypothetical protein